MLLCFDLDDTLWDVHPAIAGAEEGTLQYLRERFDGAGSSALEHFESEEKYAALRDHVYVQHRALADRCDFRGLRREIIRRGLELGGVKQAEIDRWLGEATDHFVSLRSSCTEVFDGCNEALEGLTAKHTLAAVTNGNACLTKARIQQYFSHHVSASHEGMRPKPDPLMLHAALSHFGVDPSDAIMIGDDPKNDILPARALGMHCIWVNILNRKGVFPIPSSVSLAYPGQKTLSAPQFATPPPPRPPPSAFSHTEFDVIPEGVLHVSRLNELPSAVEAIERRSRSRSAPDAAAVAAVR